VEAKDQFPKAPDCEATVITVLVVTLATLVVLTLAICLMMVTVASRVTYHIDYMSQRLESELIEIQRRIVKP
jgi:hypothetical protein